MIETDKGVPVSVDSGRRGTFDRADIDNIKKMLQAIYVRVEVLLSRANLTSLDEEQGGPISPLTPDQLRRRNERDASRRERITKINSTAQEKVGEIRRKMGK